MPFSVIRRAHLSHHARAGKSDDIEQFAYKPGWTLPFRWILGNLCYYAILPKCTSIERVMAGLTIAGATLFLVVSPNEAFFGWLVPMETTWFIFMVMTIYIPHGPLADWIDRHVPVITGFHEDHHALPSFPWYQISQRRVRELRHHVRRIKPHHGSPSIRRAPPSDRLPEAGLETAISPKQAVD